MPRLAGVAFPDAGDRPGLGHVFQRGQRVAGSFPGGVGNVPAPREPFRGPQRRAGLVRRGDLLALPGIPFHGLVTLSLRPAPLISPPGCLAGEFHPRLFLLAAGLPAAHGLPALDCFPCFQLAAPLSQAHLDPLGPARGFLLGHPTEHGDEQFGGGVGAVQPGFLDAGQHAVPFPELADEAEHPFDAAPLDAVQRPDDEDLELAAVGVVQHCSQGALVLAPVCGRVVEFVALADLDTVMGAVLLDVWYLSGLVLGVSADPHPDRAAFHGR